MRDPKDPDLICSAVSCIASLEALRETQLSNCGDADTFIAEQNARVYPATYITDLLLWTYKWVCVTDS